MSNGDDRPFVWYFWAGSVFFLSVVFAVAVGFISLNALSGYSASPEDIWRMPMLALISLVINLFRRKNRTRRAFAIIVTINIALIIMPYGPGNAALIHLSNQTYWKIHGQNRYRVADADADAYWLRVAVANEGAGPDYVFRVSTEGNMSVTKAHTVKEYKRIAGLFLPANPFSVMTEEVMASGELHLVESQQTRLAELVDALTGARLRSLYFVHGSTDVYVEYGGSTSTYNSWTVADNEALQQLLIELARLSPVETSLCDMVRDIALERQGVCSKTDFNTNVLAKSLLGG